MIGRTNAGTAGGGGGSCAVELHGGPGEVVTWSDGTNSGTVTLSSTGDGALTLPAGGYTFSFSLGSAITGAIAATLVSGVTTAVNGWVDRTPVYWFGRTFGYAEEKQTQVTKTDYSNYMEARAAGGSASTTRYFQYMAIPASGTTQAKALVDTVGNWGSGAPAQIRGTSITATNTLPVGQTGVYMTGTVSATTETSAGFQWVSGSSSSVISGINLHAIWLE